MKYRFSHWSCKFLAWMLAAVCLVFGFWAAYISLTCVNHGLYGSDSSYQATRLCRDRSESLQYDIIRQYRKEPSFKDWDKLLNNTDLRFIILEEKSGRVTASYTKGLNMQVPANLKDNVYLEEYNFQFELGRPGTVFEHVYVRDAYFDEIWFGDNTFEYEMQVSKKQEDQTLYQILLLLPEHLSGQKDTIGRGYELYRVWNYWKEDAVICLACSVLGVLVSVVFLLCQAGRRPGKEQLQRSWLDRIWLEVLLLAGVGAGVLFLLSFIALYEQYYDTSLVWEELQMIIILCDAGGVVCGLAVIGCLLSLVNRLKTKTFWRSSLISRVLNWIWGKLYKPMCWLWRTVLRGLTSLSLVPLAALVIVGVMVIELLLSVWLVNAMEPAGVLLLLILFNAVVISAAIWSAAQMKRLQIAAAALADGNLDHRLETEGMYWHFKEHAKKLNEIAGGMNKAVDQKMRSENLKTELITNVSHDIKTPLTSIINYVDLLQKPHTDAERVQYLEVLQRQSQRLKKLTQDLVEASKASTGNIPVDLKTVNVQELLNQAVEEYRQQLEAQQLEIVTAVRGDLTVLADGKLMWRVMDNLLSNVAKYALSGTRVYITAGRKEDQINICVKNISRDSLDVEAEELMERFTRADRARHTEGSGLGLNIASSLVRLQNGRFDLTVDGDLFKASILLPQGE